MPVGLEKILACIDNEALEESENIINNAKTKADNILTRANEFAQKESELIIENAEKKADLILKRAKTKAFLQERELNLKAKHEMVCFVIDEAKKFLHKMPSEEYFTLILKLFKKYIGPFKCEIIFSKSDLNRLPKEFCEELVESANKAGAQLKISKKSRDVDGGFILSYGEVEENCSFEALLESNFDVLCDKINKVLFS